MSRSDSSSRAETSVALEMQSSDAALNPPLFHNSAVPAGGAHGIHATATGSTPTSSRTNHIAITTVLNSTEEDADADDPAYDFHHHNASVNVIDTTRSQTHTSHRTTSNGVGVAVGDHHLHDIDDQQQDHNCNDNDSDNVNDTDTEIPSPLPISSSHHSTFRSNSNSSRPVSSVGRKESNPRRRVSSVCDTAVTDVSMHLPSNRISYTQVLSDEKGTGLAASSLRTASWLSVFYLLTTDVLGPTSAPWAVSQLGYLPGSIIFISLGAVAAYTGFVLWWLFLKLDTADTPVRNYADIADRLFGRWARHSVNVFQSVQLLFNVSVIILGNAQGLSQVVQHRLCFVLLSLIWTALGCGVGQIKSLKNFGFLANASIWMNLFVVFATMAVSAYTEPNYDAALQQNGVPRGPIITNEFISTPFNQQLVAVMQIVYSYGGAMMFIEFMSEMKNPREFWKALTAALSVITACYLVFGLYLYSNQGQFVINPANQGLSPYSWQTATNIVSLVSALIAAGLYGNVGMKVIYQSIVLDLLRGPDLNSIRGRYVWTGLVFGYWSVAFVVASAIPQLSNVSALVAALCIMQFTYTLPPLFQLAYDIQSDGASWRLDWKQKLFHRWWFKLFNLVLTLGALACSGLGMYSAVEAMIQGFQQSSAASSFGCQSPV